MNKKEIKRKIAELIGFTKFSFSTYKTTDGVEMNVESMELGMPIYVITPQGQLPVEDGDYEMENGMKLKVKEGMVSEIIDGSIEGEVEENVVMDEATLVDGTKVMTDGSLEVGKQLYVITEAGDKVNAPEGEHTTDSGIVVVVDANGVITGITKPDEAPQGSLEAEAEVEMTSEDLLNEFTSVIRGLMAEIKDMKDKQEKMEEQFSKFKAEPAAERVFDRKGYFEDKAVEKFSKLEDISKLKTKK